jgi:hypothetical protein
MRPPCFQLFDLEDFTRHLLELVMPFCYVQILLDDNF